MTKVTTSRPLAHDDACEGEETGCQCAVREIGWVAREARDLGDAMPEPGTPERGAWEARWEAFCTRKRVLQAYAETMRGVRGCPARRNGCAGPGAGARFPNITNTGDIMIRIVTLVAVAVLGLAGCAGSGDPGASRSTATAPVVSQSATPEQETAAPDVTGLPSPTLEQSTIPETQLPPTPRQTTAPKPRPSPVLDLVTDAGLCAADAELTNLELNNVIAPLLGFTPVRRDRTLEQDDAIRAYKNAAFSRACPGRMS